MHILHTHVHASMYMYLASYIKYRLFIYVDFETTYITMYSYMHPLYTFSFIETDLYTIVLITERYISIIAASYSYL